MPREKLERSKSVNDLDRNKDMKGGGDLLRERLKRSESFDEGQRHLIPPPEQNPQVLRPNAPRELQERQLPVEGQDGLEDQQGGEPQVLPELPLEGLGQDDQNDQNDQVQGAPQQGGPQLDPQPQQVAPQRDPFADKEPALNPQQGYSHVHISAAKVKMPRGEFKDRSKDEYDKVKQRLETKKGRSVKDREVRYAMVKGRVKSAERARARSGGDETLGIFTAPEGMLGENLTKKDVRWYREKFGKLSEKNPHMAIMPGTMAWQERRKKEGKKFAKETVLRTSGDVFHGGERVHTVDKRDDGGDTTGVKGQHLLGKRGVSRQRAQKWFSRGKDGGTSFNIGGVDMAYDICQDHSTKRTREDLHGKGQGGKDVHIVNSMGNGIDSRHIALRDGGIGVGSDADRGDSTLMRTTEDWDRNDQTEVNNPSTGRMIPGYLGKGQSSAQRLSRLDRTEFDPEQNPYESEHLGRFRLPGR